jgi:polyketide biosynthesis enoyl-CoA hydratase PksI
MTAAHDSVVLERHEDGIVVLAMRDEAGKNAMSDAFVEALSARLKEAALLADAKCVVLTGLPEIFSSGASRDTLVRLSRGELEPTDIVLPKLVLDLPVPVVAAMEGHAVGGGLALGLCADVVMIARESRYGATFMGMGFTPGMGSTELLLHVVPPALAHELLFTGEAKKGSWFEGRSGFNAIVPKVEVMPRAMAMAARIAEKPRTSLEMLKRTLSLPRRQAFERTYTMETLMHRVSFAQDDIVERIEAVHST